MAANGRGAGSSPRARGAGGCLSQHVPADGTIPRVRGAEGRSHTSCGTRDHPRRYVEQGLTTFTELRTPGPSLPVQGADCRLAVVQDHDGTIPAGARSRTTRAPLRLGSWDHPRGCGEQAVGIDYGTVNPGPSMGAGSSEGSRRGASCPGDHPRGCGTRPRAPRGNLHPRDHPRGCGEQHIGQPPSAVLSGGSQSFGGGHPHRCGEQWMRRPAASPIGGPSPQVRGVELGAVRGLQRRRAIPASAGSR